MFNAGTFATPFQSTPPSTYSYWNPADTGANVTLTESNSLASMATGGVGTLASRYTRSVTGKSSGKWRLEILWDAGVGSIPDQETGGFGITTGNGTIGSYLGFNSDGWGLWGRYTPDYTVNLYADSGGGAIVRDSALIGDPFYGTGDLYSFAIDIDGGKMWFVRTGSSVGFLNGGDPVTGTSPCITFTPLSTIYIAANSAVASRYKLRTNPSEMTLPSISGFTDGWPD